MSRRLEGCKRSMEVRRTDLFANTAGLLANHRAIPSSVERITGPAIGIRAQRFASLAIHTAIEGVEEFLGFGGAVGVGFRNTRNCAIAAVCIGIAI